MAGQSVDVSGSWQLCNQIAIPAKVPTTQTLHATPGCHHWLYRFQSKTVTVLDLVLVKVAVDPLTFNSQQPQQSTKEIIIQLWTSYQWVTEEAYVSWPKHRQLWTNQWKLMIKMKIKIAPKITFLMAPVLSLFEKWISYFQSHHS